MQQTTTYKLNKPESTDTFSVSPLNENADTLEAQLARLDGADAAETAARQEADAALDQRVTALEVHKVVVGTYLGNGGTSGTGSQDVDLGFTPVAVFLHNTSTVLLATSRSGMACLSLTGNGIHVYGDFNRSGYGYTYLAFS